MEYVVLVSIFAMIIWGNWRLGESLASPAQMFAVYWAVQMAIVVPICGFSSWYYGGLFWIAGAVFCFCVCFCLGSKAGWVNWDSGKKVHSLTRASFVLIFTGLVALFHGLYILYLYKINPLDIIWHLGQVSTVIAGSRYQGREITNVYSQLSLICVYAFPLLAGYYRNIVQKNIFCVMSMVLAMCIAFITGAKAVMITAFLFLLVGLCVGEIEWKKHISRQAYVKCVLSGIIAVLILAVALFTRLLGWHPNAASALSRAREVFLSYAAGHLIAFDHWFADYAWQGFTGGQYTFFGVFNTLKLAKRVSGIFSDYVEVGLIHTNVYTVFRSVITDFSLIGGVIFSAFLGLIAGLAYKQVMTSNGNCPLAVTVYVAVCVFILWGFVTSIFAYASYICCLIYFYLCQKFISWRCGNEV